MSQDQVCSIARAGIRPDGRAQLDLKTLDPKAPGAFGPNWFLSSPDIAREMLAIALTALTTGMHLECGFTEPIGPYSTVEYAFLVL